MRTFLVLWLGPIAGFWVWHLMTVNGLVFSLEYHDRVFAIYAALLGIEPAAIPPLFAQGLLFDGLILGLVLAFRRRRVLVVLARDTIRRLRETWALRSASSAFRRRLNEVSETRYPSLPPESGERVGAL
ncbi:hypothetical protein GCM10011390_03910 [Aureimonas endophytica]|uniref:Uncharacterized protein n=1 Tax=Aureimonas endophytica TaxID=2027858 RepID=A0A916ZCV5_9HYPH|nr:DUF6105 family protein [Aureimonas endophytica]GGD88356.1 hypothetical protein GCM10011390_03910 [Aureimonas endophytica]